MARKELARVLNDLLMELEDGRKACLFAAERCAAPELHPALVESAHDCTRALHDLQRAVHAFGEAAVTHGQPAGTLRQGWTRLRAAVGSGGAAALEQVGRQYARIDDAFAAALAAELPDPERAVVLRERDRLRGVAARLAGLRADRAQARPV
ncbi:MAG TPA: PA2169 family four-helix-bundle protein [Nevskia sp.]|nr:PA2169 family four-helix-bundle protein [Nevskia sp.]